MCKCEMCCNVQTLDVWGREDGEEWVKKLQNEGSGGTEGKNILRKEVTIFIWEKSA